MSSKTKVILKRRMTPGEKFDEFWDDFNTFELKNIKMLAQDVCRPIRVFLSDHAVWVRNEKTYSIGDSLYDRAKSSKNVWLDEGNGTVSDLKA